MTPSAPSIELVEADPLDGACWNIPAGVDRHTAISVRDFPLDLIQWWSVGPDDYTWCSCKTCPSAPTEAPAGDEENRCEARRVAHYAARIAAGDDFPPIQVIHDPTTQRWGAGHFAWLVDDGMHRISAYLLLGRTTIPAFLYAADHTAALSALAEA